MDLESPPLYQANSDDAPSSNIEHELPAYRRGPTAPLTESTSSRTEHIFQTSDGKNATWATLKLTSSSRSAKQQPVYVEGQNVTGTIELNLTVPDAIHSVDILVSYIALCPFRQATLMCYRSRDCLSQARMFGTGPSSSDIRRRSGPDPHLHLQPVSSLGDSRGRSRSLYPRKSCFPPAQPRRCGHFAFRRRFWRN
jgi:hypothetical protein